MCVCVCVCVDVWVLVWVFNEKGKENANTMQCIYTINEGEMPEK